MTDGTCDLCGDTYTKGGMTRDLQACKDDRTTSADASIVHLAVTAANSLEYWMHLDVEEVTSLARGDDVLRALWLEC